MLQVFILGLISMLGISAFAGRAQQNSLQVDLVELQWMTCENSEEALFSKLNSQPGPPSLRSVYYSETRSLELFKNGVVLRTRIVD